MFFEVDKNVFCDYRRGGREQVFIGKEWNFTRKKEKSEWSRERLEICAKLRVYTVFIIAFQNFCSKQLCPSYPACFKRELIFFKKKNSSSLTNSDFLCCQNEAETPLL